MSKTKEPVIIVGIGASAGGLEALQSLLQNLPENAHMTYIIAQHLSPTYKSMMVELLAKESALPVEEAQGGQRVKPGTIYICPPNKDITVRSDTIMLSHPGPRLYGPKPSIDIFFESLALDKGAHAIGIILSGTGSDGTRGVRAIKAEGGYVLAQEPGSAKYDSMPVSAINTGNIDLVLPPEQMGSELIELLSYPAQKIGSDQDGRFADLYTNMLSKLRDFKGVDFSVYKPSTIQRRIERRMAALKQASMADYHNYLSRNTDELEALFKDILIGVTSFFRDRAAFEALEAHLRDLIAKKEDHTIRIWAPGSSTGEEAYSVAILLSRILGEEIGKYKIQIFATDIDEDALTFARKGLYPESALIELDKKIRDRYFQIRSDAYEVVKPIREMVIFSRHDIIKDPPFLRLDMIVCRNLLIYFSQELQKRIFPAFHYAINDHGLLFLGKSESIGSFSNLFKPVDKSWKIYSAVYLGRKEPPKSVRLFESRNYEATKGIVKRLNKPTLQEKLFAYVNEHIVPMCIIVNDSMDIVFVKGSNPYLVQPEGERTNNVYKNVMSTLSIELRAAILECSKEDRSVKSSFQKVALTGDIIRYVRMVVMQMGNESEEPLYMVCFQEEESEQLKNFEAAHPYGSDEATQQLELELARTKEHLQTVIEELETSNEEMQSLNEELQSSNEELQSSNEELETTNEELQSTNEELQTAYTELRALYDEKDEHANALARYKRVIEHINNRLMISLHASKTGIFDHHVPIMEDDYWSDIWAGILGFETGELPADKTHMENWLQERVHPDDAMRAAKAHEAFFRGEVDEYRIRKRLRHKEGHWIWVESFALPVTKDEEGRATRIIGTLRDITDEMNRVEALQRAQLHHQNAISLVNLGIWERDIGSDEVTWSKETYRLFGVAEGSAMDYESFLACVHPLDRTKVEQAFQHALDEGRNLSVKHRIINPRRGTLHVKEAARIIFDEQNRPAKMIGTVLDITTEEVQLAILKEQAERFEESQRSAQIGTWEWEVESGNIWWSDSHYELFGLEKDEDITYDKFCSYVVDEDLDRFNEQVQQAIRVKGTHDFIYRINSKYGVRTMHAKGGISLDQEGEPLKMHGIVIDITEESDE